MVRRLVAFAILLLGTPATAQQPVPLLPPASDRQAPPPAIEQQPVPAAPLPEQPAASPPAAPAAPGRVFCGQSVSARPADPASVPEAYRPFIGIWSDAAWMPQLCAALIVENVTADGTATITYTFGPIGSGSRTPGGILHGTGVVRDGELLFQNNDGSQYSFKPFYADLAGRLATPQGPTYEAVFKKTY